MHGLAPLCPMPQDLGHKTESEGEKSDFTQVWGTRANQGQAWGPGCVLQANGVFRGYQVGLGLTYLGVGLCGMERTFYSSTNLVTLSNIIGLIIR